jgi:hypothetical protein
MSVNWLTLSKELLEKHYGDLADKPFFPKLVKYSESARDSSREAARLVGVIAADSTSAFRPCHLHGLGGP